MIWCIRMNEEPSMMAREMNNNSGNTNANSAIWVPRSQRCSSIIFITHHRLRVHLDRAKRKKDEAVSGLDMHLGRHQHYAVDIGAICSLVHGHVGAAHVRGSKKIANVAFDVTGGRECRGSGKGSYRESGSLARRIGRKLIDVVGAAELEDRED